MVAEAVHWVLDVQAKAAAVVVVAETATAEVAQQDEGMVMEQQAPLGGNFLAALEAPAETILVRLAEMVVLVAQTPRLEQLETVHRLDQVEVAALAAQPLVETATLLGSPQALVTAQFLKGKQNVN